MITDMREDKVFLLKPLRKNKLKKLIIIAPTNVVFIGSIFAAINISIKYSVKKFNIRVKKDCIPRFPPIKIMRIKRIISNIRIIFIN